MTRRGVADDRHSWWSEPGPDECDFCLTAYRAEAGYYCAHCDRGLCPLCATVIRARGSVLCPECAGATPPPEGGP